LAAPEEDGLGGGAALPVAGPPGGAGSDPACELRAAVRPEKNGGFQLVAMFNSPSLEVRIHRAARAGSKHA
jgi:hypothetical protein